MQVEKGCNMSQIGGDGWARFLARMRLTGGELISFSFRAERPKLAVIYINLVEDDEDNEDPLDEDDEDPLHEAIIAQRMRLSEEEVCNLWDIIPPRDDFVGVPFVTRLTSTMVDRHDMVCYTNCGNLICLVNPMICFIVILTNANYPMICLVNPMICLV